MWRVDLIRRHQPSARDGVTMVEVLVALGIVGLLLALILPAVQYSREAARRTECASHLRQIMLAQHQYLDVHGAFPGFEGRFPFAIAGFMDVPPEKIREGETPVYFCPSDSIEKGGLTGAKPSYQANTGLRRHGYRGVGDGFAGGFMLHDLNDAEDNQLVYIRDRDITDGLSATAAVSERLMMPNTYVKDVDWNDYPQLWNRLIRVTILRYSDDELAAMADDCQFHAGPPRAKQGPLTTYNHILPPNHPSCTNGIPFNDYLNFPLTASSQHPQGVNLALADGAVRFVSDNISRDVWWALGTRNGNEPIRFGGD